MDVPVSLAQSENPAAQTGVDSRIGEILSLKSAPKGNGGVKKAKEILANWSPGLLLLSDASQDMTFSI